MAWEVFDKEGGLESAGLCFGGSGGERGEGDSFGAVWWIVGDSD